MEKDIFTDNPSRQRYDIRFAGSGGQGVILASVVMAQAAVLSGRHTVQSQSYGPEARGGACRGEVIISDNQIWFPKIILPDVLVVLSAEAARKYVSDVSENALIIIDSHIKIPDDLKACKVVRIPVLETAAFKLKKPMTANMAAAGAVNALLNLFDQKVLEEGIRRHVPAETFDLNIKAMEAGMRLVTL